MGLQSWTQLSEWTEYLTISLCAILWSTVQLHVWKNPPCPAIIALKYIRASEKNFQSTETQSMGWVRQNRWPTQASHFPCSNPACFSPLPLSTGHIKKGKLSWNQRYSLTHQQSWFFFEGTYKKKQIKRRERKHLNRTCIRPQIVSSRRTFRNSLTSSSQQRPKQLNVLNQSSDQRICPHGQASSGQSWIQPLQTQSSYLGSQVDSGWLGNPSFYRWGKRHMVKTCPRPQIWWIRTKIFQYHPPALACSWIMFCFIFA